MSRIDQQTVQRIFDTADIVEVVSDFVQLKRRGANYVGLCPFHNERTPSFSVSRAKGICKCFSCGKGGNVVNFLMEHQQMSYGEALRWLARKYGIEIKEKELTDEERQREQRHEAALGALQQACEIYECHLADNLQRDPSLLSSHGIDVNAASAFHLGMAFAPTPKGEPGRLRATLANSKGITPQAIDAAGLSPSGTHDDSITDALVMPVANRYGKCIALASFLPDDESGFRISAPEWFAAEDEFAGLYQARQALSSGHSAIITEAPQQLLQLSRAGIRNTLSLIGGAYSERRIATLRRFVTDVVLLLPHNLYWDGYTFMARANELLRAGLGVKVATAHLTHPSLRSYIDATDSDTIESSLLENATDIVSFKLQNRKTLLAATRNDADRRRQYDKYLTDDLLDTLRAVADDILLQVYIETIGESLQISENTLRQMLRR